MKNNPPKILFTDQPSSGIRGTVLTLSCREFINFVEIEGIKSVFSAYGTPNKSHEYFMFAIKDGIIVNASYQDIEYLTTYFKINSMGCKDFFEFLEIKFYPIIISNEERSKNSDLNDTPAELYRKFKQSNFYGYSLKEFEVFKDAIVNGFDDQKEYRNARSIGIKTKKEYDTFIESGYRNYQDYLEAMEGGFEDTKVFYNARELGVLTYNKYKDFLEKGYKEMLDKVAEIEVDAEKMYQNRQYEQLIQLRYLAAEKLSEIVYFKLFNKKISIDDNLNLSEIIRNIEEKLNTKLNSLDELNKWRIKRNEIVHEHIKVEQGTVDIANQFFAEFMRKLRAEFDKLLK